MDNVSTLTIAERAQALDRLGVAIKELVDTNSQSLYNSARENNPWFTPSNVKLALIQLADKYLKYDVLIEWAKASGVTDHQVQPRSIGVIGAGNIPLVCFIDVIAVLLSGYSLQLKLSEDDKVLPRYLLNMLEEIEPRLASSYKLVEKLKGYQAVIATGSRNTNRYFSYYFKAYPHLLRSGRTSVAVLTGTESEDELKSLLKDVLIYFGLGCRSVTHLYVPYGYDFTLLQELSLEWKQALDISRFWSNYNYYLSIYLMEQQEVFTNGVLLIKEDASLPSPVGSLYYSTYKNIEEVETVLALNRDSLQCIVATPNSRSLPSIPLGKAQEPELHDFADEVDPLLFLTNL